MYMYMYTSFMRTNCGNCLYTCTRNCTWSTVQLKWHNYLIRNTQLNYAICNPQRLNVSHNH